MSYITTLGGFCYDSVTKRDQQTDETRLLLEQSITCLKCCDIHTYLHYSSLYLDASGQRIWGVW